MNSNDMNHDENAAHEFDPVAEARAEAPEQPTVEPPPELIGQVMWRTRHQSVRDNSRRRTAGRKEEGLDMAKKVLIGLIGVAAAGLLIAYISGGVPATTGTEGTIGAAQRYNAEQITKSDVKVENAALAGFMQSEVFEKLARQDGCGPGVAGSAAGARQRPDPRHADSTLAQALASLAYRPGSPAWARAGSGVA
jgi:hypothetical protein